MSDEKEPLDLSSTIDLLIWLNEIGNPSTEPLDFDACIGMFIIIILQFSIVFYFW